MQQEVALLSSSYLSTFGVNLSQFSITIALALWDYISALGLLASLLFRREEVEVAALRGLGDGAAVQGLVAPRRRGRRPKALQPAGDLVRLKQEVDPLVLGGQA